MFSIQNSSTGSSRGSNNVAVMGFGINHKKQLYISKSVHFLCFCFWNAYITSFFCSIIIRGRLIKNYQLYNFTSAVFQQVAVVVSGGSKQTDQECHTVSLDTCQHNDRTTLVNSCLHHKFSRLNMSVFDRNSHLRESLIFCFYLKKTATEAHRMLSSTYGEATFRERTCRE